MRLFRITPRPCRHEAAGRPHRTTAALYRCLTRFGVPGFLLTEELRPAGRGRR